jgi:HSP20 family molecular chaperone IbpA
VDAQQISADLRHGVLTIVIPKTPDRGPRKVDVT